MHNDFLKTSITYECTCGWMKLVIKTQMMSGSKTRQKGQLKSLSDSLDKSRHFALKWLSTYSIHIPSKHIQKCLKEIWEICYLHLVVWDLHIKCFLIFCLLLIYTKWLWLRGDLNKLEMQLKDDCFRVTWTYVSIVWSCKGLKGYELQSHS